VAEIGHTTGADQRGDAPGEVTQLAHVLRPAVGEQRLGQLGGAPHAAEVIEDEEDVGAPLHQRR
jgi:hypothetical protein